MEKVKIIIVDDHKIFRHGICHSLSMECDYDVVADVGSGRMAVKLALQYHPDIVLMDISLSDLNGVEATRQIKANNFNIKVIGLSIHDKKIYVTRMLSAGASGYILKSASFEELQEGIKTVLSGEMFFCRDSRLKILDREGNFLNDKRISAFSLLSNKEMEVLKLIAEGYKNKEMADKLNISARTVEVHRANLTKKLNISSIAGLTKLAITEGIISLNDWDHPLNVN